MDIMKMICETLGIIVILAIIINIRDYVIYVKKYKNKDTTDIVESFLEDLFWCSVFVIPMNIILYVTMVK